ncbi:DDE-type integrase/transposase/recombinase [Halobacteriovorax sp. HLS]|uniref:DDE-type integrase/transposase/recombinase n=1 Tax=Halobacteriovorax sp. HLS TaxID=2234000 RepID=UPI003515EA88
MLACGYDSWRKYVKEFRGEIIKRRKVKKYNCGIRASRVNEIWHMDITEFKLKDGGKVYLQVIVDNFSRKVINWKLSQKKGQSLSVKTMLDTTKEIIPETLLIDGGGENTGNEIKKLFLGRGITALVAKKDVVFSNSMVESFFRILKQKFICKYCHYKLSRIYRIVERSVKYFNDTPLGIFHGAKPNEVYNGLSDFSDLREKLALGIGRSRAERPMINLSCASGNIVSFTI